jgi:hypothetical protein
VVDVTQLEKLWHKGPDFTKDGAAIPLIFRVATVRYHSPCRRCPCCAAGSSVTAVLSLRQAWGAWEAQVPMSSA